MEKTKQINSPLLISIVLLLSSLIFLIFSIVSIGDYNKSKTSYSNLTYKEFTVDEVIKREDPELGFSYSIRVCETEKNIIVNNLLAKRSVREGLDSLEKGDKLFCYLIEDSMNYDAVEIKDDDTILSLEEYNNIYRQNSLLGIAIMPLGFILFLAFSIKYLLIHLITNKH